MKSQAMNSFASHVRVNFSATMLVACAIGASLFAAAQPAVASDVSTATQVEHTIDVKQHRQLDIRNGVGSLELRYSDQPTVTVKVHFEGQRSGVLRRKRDVSSMDIGVTDNQDTLRLQFEEDNVQARWVVTAPSFAKVTINQGVGSINVEHRGGDMQVKLGVGDVDIELDEAKLGRFSGNVGVGAIRLQGIAEVHSERRIVTEKSTARGNGDSVVTVDVGVGDISVRDGGN